jgi:hypothetical protein
MGKLGIVMGKVGIGEQLARPPIMLPWRIVTIPSFPIAMSEREWQDASWPCLERMIATGQYPMVAQVVRDATHPPSEVVFERGLDCVIDGIVSRLGRGSSAKTSTS